MDCQNVLVWNVRGMNAKAHRDAIRQLAVAERTSLVCLQENKLVVILPYDVMNIIRPGFDYVYLPVVQTRGGILVAWLTLV
jgi:exonuclease III